MSKDKFSMNGNVGTIVCEDKPKLNVMQRDDFLDRAAIVFQAYEDILKKTLGAYGSPTIISSYPYRHVTKDGFTVCRNIEFDQFEGSDVDKVIGGMIVDICGRLNYSVGDGTTSAIIATNKVFQAFMHMLNDINSSMSTVRPKEFMEAFQEVTDEIVEKLNLSATQITPDNLVESIRKIVHISSNGNEKMVDIITTIYEEIGFPAIVCETSDNAETYYEITDGYTLNAKIADDVYINNDNDTAFYKNADVIIFGHKVTPDTYHDIIKPLNQICRACDRKLICLAPWFDDKLLSGELRRDLLGDLKKSGTINLVIASYFNSNNIAKQQIADLAIILGTTVIDHDLEDAIVDRLNAPIEDGVPNDLTNIINCFDRKISGILVAPSRTEGTLVRSEEKVYDEERLNNCLFTLGFADNVTLGKKNSIFKSSHYDEELYNMALHNAENTLEEVIQKFATLGTYTRDVYEAQNRLCSLKMKIAKIYVGGESEMSRDLLKDSTEDAIRAAESAYRYGYVPGCNFMISKIADGMYADLDKLRTTEDTYLKKSILYCISQAFGEVYADVLENAFPNQKVPLKDVLAVEPLIDILKNQLKINTDAEVLRALISVFREDAADDYCGEMVHNPEDEIMLPVSYILVSLSILKEQIFDLDIMDFSDNVINSVKTDVEILKATSDLLSILVVGNQVLIASWNHSHIRND